MTFNTIFNKSTQVLLPVLTITGFALTSLKMPAWGLTVTLFSEIFWLYAAWQAWKKAKQIGILITAIILTVILSYGVVNYWIIK